LAIPGPEARAHQAHWIGETRVMKQSRVAQAECTLWSDEPGATIPEAVDETLQIHAGLHTQFIGCAQIGAREGCTLSNATMATGEGISN